jgi:chemotaxis protein MotB
MDDWLDELETAPEAASDNAWAVGYLDILLLLLTLFAVLLAMTYMQIGDSQTLPNEVEMTNIFTSPQEPAKLDPAVILAAFQARPPAPAASKRSEEAPPQILVEPAANAPSAPAVEVSVTLTAPRLPPALLRVAEILSSQQGEQFDLLLDKRQLRLEMRDDILFSSARADLGAEGRLLLDQLSDSLLDQDFDIIVEGHTDDVPIATRRFPSNWELSTFRASSVARYLIERGIAQQRVQVIGYADTQPLLPNDSALNRAKNRRVTVLLRIPELTQDNAEPLRVSSTSAEIEHL